VTLTVLYVFLIVQESMEMIDNPLHEAAKRGNISFLNECIANRVCLLSSLVSNMVYVSPTLDDDKIGQSDLFCLTSNLQNIFK